MRTEVLWANNAAPDDWAGLDFTTYSGRASAALLRFAVTATGDADLAKDLVQEVMFKAFRQWDHIGRMARPHAYLRRMIINESISWRRKWSRQIPMPDSALDCATGDPTIAIDMSADLWQLVSSLPSQQRATVSMRYFQDLSDLEISVALGCQPATVRGYLRRALTTLRSRIAEGQ